jgi:hypothetical protein
MNTFTFFLIYFIIAFIIRITTTLNVFGSIFPKNMDDNEEKLFDMICVMSMLWPMTIISAIFALPIIGLIELISLIKKKRKS